jgi:predicted DNA-binding transcriptional regulator YafY
MATYPMIKRFKIILESISKNNFPSKQKILDILFDTGFEINERTLDRDVNRLRDDFGIEILYSYTHKGYYLDAESSLALPDLLRYFELLSTGSFLTGTLKSYKSAMKHISFDQDGGLKGTDWLPTILEAIVKRQFVQLVYQKFMDEEKTHTIAPYLLREFRNRWYVVGLYKNDTTFISFGVDRIKSLQVLDRKFEVNTSLKPKEWFDNVIGFPYNNTDIKKVVLSFTPMQGKYIKTLPLHHSQEILIDNDTELRIALYLIINFELKMEILKYGSAVKVLEPQYLVDNIKQELLEALKKY